MEIVISVCIFNSSGGLAKLVRAVSRIFVRINYERSIYRCCTMKFFYALVAVLGIALPYKDLLPFMLEHGFNINHAVEQLYTNRISTGFANDFFITAIVIVAFTAHEGWRIGLKPALLLVCFAGMLLGGASFALPLFLFLREIEREKHLQSA